MFHNGGAGELFAQRRKPKARRAAHELAADGADTVIQKHVAALHDKHSPGKTFAGLLLLRRCSHVRAGNAVMGLCPKPTADLPVRAPRRMICAIAPRPDQEVPCC